MDKEELKATFDKYESDLQHWCGIEKLNYVTSSLIPAMEESANELRETIYNEVTEFDTVNLKEPLTEFLQKIYNIHIKAKNSPKKYSEITASQYLKLYHSLSGYLEDLNSMQATIADKVVPAERVKTPKLSEFNKPHITKKQVLLIMHLFRKYKLVITEIDDKSLSRYFGEMTGFSPEQLRKDYSVFKKEELDFKNDDLNTLKDILVKMTEEIVNIKVK
jgi:hypothetical protein